MIYILLIIIKGSWEHKECLPRIQGRTMGQVYIVSDLHIGHKNIMNFAGDYRHGETYEENIHSIVKMWNSVVTKYDKVFVLGDVCFRHEYLDVLDELKGRKVLIRGNHDGRFSTRDWLMYFEEVEGIVRYKNYWLTHAPIHPAELRGKKNIHGHVHQNSILDGYNECDERYINVCIENTGGAPINFERIKAGERGWSQELDSTGVLHTTARKQLKG